MTVPLAISLAELRTPMEKRYRSTIYCVACLQQDASGKLRGKYCGHRWCLVCNRIRTARAIDRYVPAIARWTDPQLVTLTIPNVKGTLLKETIGDMVRDLVTVGRAIRRTDKLVLHALRKLECTYNPDRDDYHPHFHVAVEGMAAAKSLVRRWLALHPESSMAAQDIRACDPGSLKELFKYFTKLVATGQGTAPVRSIAATQALDTIFNAMQGRRVYQPMGFKIAVPSHRDENGEVGTLGETRVDARQGEAIEWEWMQAMHDWVDADTGDLLTGYEPSDKYRQLVASIAHPSAVPDPAGPSGNVLSP